MTAPPLQLRRAGPGDAAAVRQLTRDAYTKWIAVIGREPRPMTADYDHAVRAHRIDIAEDGSGLAALIEMIPGDGFLLIENIAVRENRQGQGIAGTLLLHAEATALATGLAELRLYTNAAFHANLAFYLRQGFAEAGCTGLADGGTMVHFVKRVS